MARQEHFRFLVEETPELPVFGVSEDGYSIEWLRSYGSNRNGWRSEDGHSIEWLERHIFPVKEELVLLNLGQL